MAYYNLINSYLAIVEEMELEHNLDFKNYEFNDVAHWIAERKCETGSLSKKFVRNFDSQPRRIKLGVKPVGMPVGQT